MPVEYVGMTVQEATTKAEQAGFEVAIEVPGPQYLDCQYRLNRITFKVVNGIIQTAKIG